MWGARLSGQRQGTIKRLWANGDLGEDAGDPCGTVVEMGSRVGSSGGVSRSRDGLGSIQCLGTQWMNSRMAWEAIGGGPVESPQGAQLLCPPYPHSILISFWIRVGLVTCFDQQKGEEKKLCPFLVLL